MGISRANGALGLWHELVRTQRLVVAGLRMAELGNQKLREDVLGMSLSAKKLWTAMGIDHVSIDINGKDGALPIDLRRPIADPALLESFDVVTNFGTMEHVEGQYEGWRNVHALAKAGGFFLHLCPAVGSWPGHCPYRYDGTFFPALVGCCGYEALKLEEIGTGDRKLFAAILRKTRREFPAEGEFRARVRIQGPA